MPYTYSFPCPALTADAVVFSESDQCILLIKRANEPFRGMWALPGGFVDPDEEPLVACLRELREETDLQLVNGNLIGIFGEKGRDPRGWTVSVAYFFKVDSAENSKAKAGSDSSELNWFSLKKLPLLAFDHQKIIEEALAKFM
ncbi:hypothetical protein P872_03760 [Rhodonellum psychrophilum GCM71 = DSM 17998]|uniref:Nudix hydrolase domain-containing protein n=2 Tax=Rhodonellum TaxID=336827 RepID=U5C1I7_9BACT|nr:MULTISPECIES: NUDIX hydrolase [Rhodonellum]ERM82786.1 hypothetical protein P872_03760 [Rhodonellum psychrophilum GCM71 = DSM 17998]SDY95877.1 8-oxo-dGTP diphosphatase [Rhodonellum ikkaensis]